MNRDTESPISQARNEINAQTKKRRLELLCLYNPGTLTHFWGCKIFEPSHPLKVGDMQKLQTFANPFIGLKAQLLFGFGVMEDQDTFVV